MSAAAAHRLTTQAERLRALEVGDVLTDEPLAPRTSVRVGGRAAVFVRPTSVEALVRLLRYVRDEGLPLVTLGGGANTLVGDGGVEGVVLKLSPGMFPEEVSPNDDAGGGAVTLGAGAAISRLPLLMKARGWVGAEFLAGIPGTIGGAVAMNAGTKLGECMSRVARIELATCDGLGWLERGALAFGYRNTSLPHQAVVTRVRFELLAGDVASSKATMDADLAYRKRTQPLSLPNFGSVFTNPPGDHAGRLIERVGLKGHTDGAAQISTLHANWIVNLGGATAASIVRLMELARLRVREELGVELTPEVRRIGRFSP